jgi:hypothetical protein
MCSPKVGPHATAHSQSLVPCHSSLLKPGPMLRSSFRMQPVVNSFTVPPRSFGSTSVGSPVLATGRRPTSPRSGAQALNGSACWCMVESATPHLYIYLSVGGLRCEARGSTVYLRARARFCLDRLWLHDSTKHTQRVVATSLVSLDRPGEQDVPWQGKCGRRRKPEANVKCQV